MKIYNCYRELEKTQRIFEESLIHLQKLNNSLMNDLSDLHNRGWSDENYSNLRTVLTNRSSELKEIIKHTDSAIIELKKRSLIIKNYYSIKF
jgi:hypothetical protein